MLSISKTASALHNDKYRPDIDGIRAIAVSLVVICHAFPQWFPSGFVGVDIFFVISGYLISSILIKDTENNNFSIKRFYQRRIRRIVPALVIVLLFTLLLGWYTLFKPEFISLGKHFLASTLFSENFLLWSEVSYFDTAAELKPTLHFWSLAIEEQFYIVWPIAIYLAYKLRWNLLYVCLILAGLSLALNVYDVAHNPTAAYYSPLGRSWELMIGAILATLQFYHPNALSKFKNLQSVLGFALIIAALAIAKPAQFPGFVALLPTMGAFFLLSAGKDSWLNRHILSLSPMIWVGLISYPLYLWHWPLMSFTRIIFGELTPAKAAVCIVFSVIAAFLTFIIIELPIRKSKSTSRKLLPTLAFTLVLSVLVYTNAISPRIKNDVIPTKNEWSYLENTLTKKYDNSTGKYILGSGSDDIIFIGDSHLAQYAPYIDKVLKANQQSASLYVGGGCLPIANSNTVEPLRKSCHDMINKAYKEAMGDQYKTVVIGGAWNRYFLSQDDISGDYFYAGNHVNTPQGRDLAMARLKEDIAHLQALGKKVILILDNPKQDDLFANKNRLFMPATVTVEKNMVVPRNAFQKKLSEYMHSFFGQTNISIIDPDKSICNDKDECHLTDGVGTIMYKDTDHFNPDWIVNNGGFLAPIWQH